MRYGDEYLGGESMSTLEVNRKNSTQKNPCCQQGHQNVSLKS